MIVHDTDVVKPCPELSDTLGQLRALRLLIRDWRPCLDAAEFNMMAYLVDNTIGWGRRRVRASYSDMVTGAKRGKWYLPPNGMSVRNTERLMRRLLDRGIIFQHEGRRADRPSVIEINLAWQPPAAAPANDLQPVANVEPTVSSVGAPAVISVGAPTVSSVGTTREPSKRTIEKNHPSRCAAHRSFSLSGEGRSTTPVSPSTNYSPDGAPIPAAFLVRQRTRPASLGPIPTVATAARPANVALPAVVGGKGRKPGLPQTNDMCWRDAWLETYPGTVPKPFTHGDRKMMVTLRKHVETYRDHPDWFEFLWFVVTNWREIMAKEFGWMTRSPPPAYPDARFLCTQKFSGKFLDAYHARHDQQRLDAASGEEQEYLLLIQNGASHDEALREIGRRQGISKSRQETEQAKEHFVKQVRSFQAERDRAIEQARRAEILAATAKPAPPPPKPFDHGVNAWENPHLINIPDYEFTPFEEWEDEPVAA